MNPYMDNQISPEFNILDILWKKNPLVICITNDVVRTFTANGLLAIGASPIMSECSEDLKDLIERRNMMYQLFLILWAVMQELTDCRWS